MLYDLVVLGDLVADIVMPIEQLPLRPNEHGWAEGLFVELGGSCTTMVSSRRMNLTTVSLGVMGDDDYGQQMLTMLESEGVITRFIGMDPERKTTLCVVVTDRTGQHVFLGIKDGKPPPHLRPEWDEVLQQTRSLFISGYTLRDVLWPEETFRAMDLARGAGAFVVFDPGPSLAYLTDEIRAAALQRASALLLTLDEAQMLVPDGPPAEMARALHALGPSVVVLKAGADGCYVSAGGEVLHHPGFVVEVVDTVGAGDAFAAAFVAAHLRGGSWRECAALANAMGAAMAATQGAGRRVPSVARLRELLGDEPAARLLTESESVQEPTGD